MAAIVSDVTVTGADGSTVRTITYADGSQSVQFTAGPNTPAANNDTIRSRAAAALTANATYQALASPTVAQNTAQLKTVTKEATALIKLALGLLDDTTGT